MATANITTQIQAIGTEETKTLGNLVVPLAIALDVTAPQIHLTKVYLATGVAKEILSLGTADSDDLVVNFKVLALKPAVDTTIVLEGTAATDNSAFMVEANHVFIMTSGKTTEYAATSALRAAATSQNITSVTAIQSVQASAAIEVLCCF